MLAYLPVKDYNSILVVNALNGMLPLVLRDNYPDAEIVCGEVFPYFTEHLANLGFTVEDWNKIDMKFDLVIGNPPYQNSNSQAKSGKLWPKFITKSIDLLKPGGHLAMITPNSWTKGKIAPQGSGKLWKTLTALDLRYVNNRDCGGHFPGVGVTIAMFALVNQPHSGPGILEQDGEKIPVDFAKLDMLPTDVKALGIVEKFFNRRHKVINHTLVTNTRNHLLDLQDQGQHKVFSNGKFQYTNSDQFDCREKILIPWANTYEKHITFGEYVAGDGCVYAYTDGHGANWLSVLTSKLYRYCLAVTRMAQHNEGVRSFPVVDFTKSWTDSELYAHFKLTREEISLIETKIK